MLLVVLLCFNWWAGVSPTGPTVHFYVRHIKERANGGREDGDRCEESRSWSDPAFIFHCHPAPFHPFLVWFLLSFPCLYLLCIVFSPDCVCPLSCGLHLSVIIISVSLSLHYSWRLPFSHQKTLLSHFFPFIYVLYITSHSFIHWFRGWRPSFKGMCVPYIGQPLLIGTMQWLVFINKSSYTELKLACLQESCKLLMMKS